MKNYRNHIYRMVVAMNKYEGLSYTVAKNTGVKENTLLLLYALGSGETLSQKQICDEWLIPKTTLNTVVKECVNGGYITLSSESHSKEKIIKLTESGRAFAHTVLKKLYDAEERAMERVVNEFGEDFILAIERFVNCFEQEYGREKPSE